MEHFRIDHGDMFSKYGSGSLSPSRDKQVSDAVARLTDDYVLNVDEEGYIQYLIDEYTLHLPVIHFDEPRKVMVDPEYLPRYWGAQRAIERTMLRYIIPISGDHNLLYFCPSTFLLSGSGIFHVGSTEIYTDILATSDDAEEVKREIESAKDSCRKCWVFWRTISGHTTTPCPGPPETILLPAKKRSRKRTHLSPALECHSHQE